MLALPRTKRVLRIAGARQKSFLHPRSRTGRLRRGKRDHGGRASVTRAGKNHARVNQSPVVCILRSVGPKLGANGRRARRPSGLESGAAGPVAAEFKRVFARNRTLSMQMIGARENGTRHRETRELLPLPPHLGLHLLYEPCTKHDDGNDAWRRYWAGRKYLPHSKLLRARECAGCRAIDGTSGPANHAISGRTAGRCFKYVSSKRGVMYVGLNVFCQEFHVCRYTAD